MGASRTPVEDYWQQFKSKVLHAGISPILEMNLRRTFYAGAWLVVAEALAHERDGTEETLLLHLRSISSEVEAFSIEVHEGRA